MVAHESKGSYGSGRGLSCLMKGSPIGKTDRACVGNLRVLFSEEITRSVSLKFEWTARRV